MSNQPARRHRDRLWDIGFRPPAVSAERAATRSDRQRSVTRQLHGEPMAVYTLVTDVVATAAYSEELVEVIWSHRQNPDRPTVGDQFTSRNTFSGMTWNATSTVTAAEPGHRFSFAVSGPENPTATWTFGLSPTARPGLTEVSYRVELGDGPSMFDTVTGGDTTRRASAETHRLDALARDMSHLLAQLDLRLAAEAAPHSVTDTAANQRRATP